MRRAEVARLEFPTSKGSTFIPFMCFACAEDRLAPASLATPPAARDTVVETPPAEQARIQYNDREWIIVPGEEPGQFLVIEVNRVRHRSVPVYQDF